MAEPGRRLSPDQLIDYARVDGMHPLPSRPQIGRWRRAGILPPIEVEWRGRARGRASLYPESAQERLLAVYRARAADPRCGRSLRLLRWMLWWSGEPIDTTRLRQDLRTSIDRLERKLQRFDRRLALSQGEDGEDRFDQVARRPATLPALRAIQSRLSSVPDAYANVLRGIVGALRGNRSQDFGVYRLEFLFGVGLASSLIQAANPDGRWAGADVESVVREVTQAGTPAARRASLDATTDADLSAARQELRALYKLHDLVRNSALERSGLRSSHALLPANPSASESMPLFAWWLSFRRRPAFQPVLETVRSLAALHHTSRSAAPDAEA